jgi:hypothetical protein
MPENEVTGTDRRKKVNGPANEPISRELDDESCSEEEVRGERSGDDAWFLEIYPRAKYISLNYETGSPSSVRRR